MSQYVDPELLSAVRGVVAAAGAKIEEIRAGGPVATTRKDDDSPVTRADRAGLKKPRDKVNG